MTSSPYPNNYVSQLYYYNNGYPGLVAPEKQDLNLRMQSSETPKNPTVTTRKKLL
jgi:hypothetical protein